MNQLEFPVQLPPKYLKKTAELNINPADIEEQFIRGSGKGGQKINKTSSTVYLKHSPTATEIRCQKHREQSKNRQSAYKLLIDKIELQIKGVESEAAQKIFKLRKQKQKRSKRAKEKILQDKAQRGELKESRKRIS